MEPSQESQAMTSMQSSPPASERREPPGRHHRQSRNRNRPQALLWSRNAAAEPSSEEHGIVECDRLFKVARRVKQYLAEAKPINEDGTRAFFIDKWLEALGYSDFDDIEHGSLVASGDFPDYVVRSGGHHVMAIEAKRIGYGLGAKEAAQIVKYGSVLGLRWGLLTDGRYLQVYDIPVTGLAPEDRLVLSIDLADFADREDFDTRIWPAAALLTKSAMQTGEALERHAARELIRARLTDPSSSSVGALKADLEQRKVILSPHEIVALVNDLIG
jgi:predicted type IV restriction endonuclease